MSFRVAGTESASSILEFEGQITATIKATFQDHDVKALALKLKHQHQLKHNCFRALRGMFSTRGMRCKWSRTSGEVASCVILFSLGHMPSFNIVWIVNWRYPVLWKKGAICQVAYCIISQRASPQGPETIATFWGRYKFRSATKRRSSAASAAEASAWQVVSSWQACKFGKCIYDAAKWSVFVITTS